jgi:hypothetical protein
MPVLPQHDDDAAAAQSARRHGQHARNEHAGDAERTDVPCPGTRDAEALILDNAGAPCDARAPLKTGAAMTSLVTRRAVLLGLGAAAVLAHPARSRAQGLPNVVVTKDPTCGCCAGWADHMRSADFPVEVVETHEINRVKCAWVCRKPSRPVTPPKSMVTSWSAMSLRLR